VDVKSNVFGIVGSLPYIKTSLVATYSGCSFKLFVMCSSTFFMNVTLNILLPVPNKSLGR